MMDEQRLNEIEELLPTGHCYECGADEYVYELIYSLREHRRWSFEIEANHNQPTKATIKRDGTPIFIGHNWSDYIGEIENLRTERDTQAATLKRLRELLSDIDELPVDSSWVDEVHAQLNDQPDANV